MYFNKKKQSTPLGRLSVWDRLLPVTRIGVNTLLRRNDELGFSKANANRALIQFKQHHDDNPSTHVHDLVDYLQNIKKDCTA
jgi:hypothetical protein